MRAFWEKQLGVFPAERRDCAKTAGLFLVVFFFFAIFRNYVDATFLKRAGPDALPLMLCASGAASMLLFAGLKRLSRRIADRLLLGLLLLGSGACQFGLGALGGSLGAALLYVLLGVMDGFLLVQLWNLAQERFDARQGRRLFRLFMAAQVLGATIGGFATGPLVRLIGVEALLWLCASSSCLIGTFLIRDVGAVRRNDATSPPPAPSPAEVLDAFAKRPIFRFLCVCAVLPNLVLPALAYQFGVLADARFDAEHGLLEFLGWFRGGLTASIFLCIVFCGPLHNRASTRTLALFAPVNQCLAFGLLSAWFSLWSAAYAQFSSIFLQRVVLGPLTKQLSGLMPGRMLAWSQIFVRGTLTQGASLTGAALLLLIKQALPPQTPAWPALAISLLWTIETLRFRRRYGVGLKDVMVERGLDLDHFDDVAAGRLDPEPESRLPLSIDDYPEDLLDLMASMDLPSMDPEKALAGLAASDAAVRARAAASFALSRDPRALNALVAALGDVETVRRASIEALVRFGTDAAPLLEGALESSNPRVRTAVLETLRQGAITQVDLGPFIGRALIDDYSGRIAAEALSPLTGAPVANLCRDRLLELGRERLHEAFLALGIKRPGLRLAYAAFAAGNAPAAAEYLDAALDPVDSARVSPLIDSIPEAERIACGRAVLPLPRFAGPENALAAATRGLDATAAALAFVALTELPRSPGLIPLAQAGLVHPDAEVRGAARYALNRLLDKEADMPPFITQVRLLGDFPLFAGLGVRELRALASIAQTVVPEDGAPMLRRGDPFPGLFLVAKGRVVERAPDGRTVSIVPTKGFFNAEGVFLGQRARNDHLSDGETELMLFTTANFLELIEIYPRIGMNMCRALSQMVSQSSDKTSSS